MSTISLCNCIKLEQNGCDQDNCIYKMLLNYFGGDHDQYPLITQNPYYVPYQTIHVYRPECYSRENEHRVLLLKDNQTPLRTFQRNEIIK